MYLPIICFLLILIGFSEAASHSNLVSAYYIFAGIGAPATFFAIVATYHQTQKQIKKDVFFRKAEIITDELYALVVEISYWWTHSFWQEYALNYKPKGLPITKAAHKNKTTLAIHASKALNPDKKAAVRQVFALQGKIDIKEEEVEQKNAEINEMKDSYISLFNQLTGEAGEIDNKLAKTYKKSPLGKLAEELKKY